MPRGPGKYDDMATLVRERVEAKAVVVIVFEGNRGNGFSIQIAAPMRLNLAPMLRHMAEEIDAANGAEAASPAAGGTPH